MRRALLLIGILLPSVVLAEATQTPKELCMEKLGIEVELREIHGIFESSHDPQLFQVRRCITEMQKKLSTQRQVERQAIREAARFSKSAERSKILRDQSEMAVDQAIRRRILKEERFRSPTNVVNLQERLKTLRSSRRTLIENQEDIEKLNTLRHRPPKRALPDPCSQVRVISKNTTCPR